MISVRSRKTCSSRSRKNAVHRCDDASLHVFPANSPALAILGFLFDLEFLSGFVRHLRRRWRFSLIFYFAARQEES